ncbi:hypothetical protein CDD83_10250 [Cordyceps sp. RAO-2017]|nr:hypothetical protein CDD83_10250 [Cordyceps sp. RAO-2017]
MLAAAGLSLSCSCQVSEACVRWVGQSVCMSVFVLGRHVAAAERRTPPPRLPPASVPRAGSEPDDPGAGRGGTSSLSRTPASPPHVSRRPALPSGRPPPPSASSRDGPSKSMTGRNGRRNAARAPSRPKNDAQQTTPATTASATQRPLAPSPTGVPSGHRHQPRASLPDVKTPPCAWEILSGLPPCALPCSSLPSPPFLLLSRQACLFLFFLPFPLSATARDSGISPAVSPRLGVADTWDPTRGGRGESHVEAPGTRSRTPKMEGLNKTKKK